MRVEVVGEPFLELAVALVAGVCDSLKQLVVAPRTTDVLGWAVALGLDQAGIKHARFGIDQAFDLDRVLPAIAEVVEIPKGLCADVFEDVVEPRFASIHEVVGPICIGIGGTPAGAASSDLVQMAVGPAHGCLDGQMQPVKPDIEWHFDAAQDHGLDVVESDLEAGDGGGTHATTLRRSSSADQFHGKSSSSLWIA